MRTETVLPRQLMSFKAAMVFFRASSLSAGAMASSKSQKNIIRGAFSRLVNHGRVDSRHRQFASLQARFNGRIMGMTHKLLLIIATL